jgi:hypothetical protein
MKKVLAAFVFLSLAVFVTLEWQWRWQRAEKVTEAWQQIDTNGNTTGRFVASQQVGMTSSSNLQNELMRRLNLERREASLPGGKWEAKHRVSLSELFSSYRLVVEPQSSGRLTIKDMEWIKSTEELPASGVQVTDWKPFFEANADLFGLQYVDVGQLKSLSDGSLEFPATNWQGRPARLHVQRDPKGRLLRLSLSQD